MPKMNPGFTSALLPHENYLPWSGIEGLRSACLGMALLDLDALTSPGNHLFTPREGARASQIGVRRLKAFTAARMALKILARQLGLVEESRPDWMIETLGPDGVRPCLAESNIFCSASHSARFAVAVAYKHPVGIDIEMFSSKIMRTRHLFMKPKEEDLISLSILSPERIATRVWTIKEATAKALGLHLFDAFRKVEVVSVGEEEGVMRFQRKEYLAKHAEGSGQVITLLRGDAL
jgi:phosphopantetheinyl transferase